MLGLRLGSCRRRTSPNGLCPWSTICRGEGKGQAFEDSPLPVLATTVCGILRLLLPSFGSRLADRVLHVEGMVSGLL